MSEDGRQDLLAGAVRGTPPDDPSWRADALARSGHSRAADRLRPPQADFDPERAAETCAAIARVALGDFAPALLLLPRRERERAQAVTACAFALFDFARQGGVEGERLAEINRWEFALDAALAGEPVGQPVFVRLALADRRRELPREALATLFTAARGRAVVARPRTPEEAARRATVLAGALAEAVLGAPAAPALVDFASGAVRVALLCRLPDELRANRCALAESELAPPLTETAPDRLAAVVAGECRRVRTLLTSGGRAVAELPPEWRGAGGYLLFAALRLATDLERAGERLLAAPPRLGLWTRLRLLWRARRAASAMRIRR